MPFIKELLPGNNISISVWGCKRISLLVIKSPVPFIRAIKNSTTKGSKVGGELRNIMSSEWIFSKELKETIFNVVIIEHYSQILP